MTLLSAFQVVDHLCCQSSAACNAHIKPCLLESLYLLYCLYSNRYTFLDIGRIVLFIPLFMSCPV